MTDTQVSQVAMTYIQVSWVAITDTQVSQEAMTDTRVSQAAAILVILYLQRVTFRSIQFILRVPQFILMVLRLIVPTLLQTENIS